MIYAKVTSTLDEDMDGTCMTEPVYDEIDQAFKVGVLWNTTRGFSTENIASLRAVRREEEGTVLSMVKDDETTH
jgi:hypothetical protein